MRPADHSGHYPDIAYRAGLALPLALQLAALLWFARGVLLPQSDTAELAAAVAAAPLSEPAAQ